MLIKTLEYVRVNLNNYINSLVKPVNPQEYVRLGNIAYVEDFPSTTNFDERNLLYISLVNFQEEFTKKNSSFSRKNINGTVDYQNPPIFLNLYLLICASHVDYNVALQRLSQVITFFQATKKFTFSSQPIPPSTDAFTFDEEEQVNFQVSFDLYSLTFEQINHLWGSLGGKQVPFALYKVRLVEMEEELRLRGGGVITEIIQKS